jgi:hypothetical protein
VGTSSQAPSCIIAAWPSRRPPLRCHHLAIAPTWGGGSGASTACTREASPRAAGAEYAACGGSRLPFALRERTWSTAARLARPSIPSKAVRREYYAVSGEWFNSKWCVGGAAEHAVVARVRGRGRVGVGVGVGLSVG